MDIQGTVKAVLPLKKWKTGLGEGKSQTIIIEYENGNSLNKLALTNTRNATLFRRCKVGEKYLFKVAPMSKMYKEHWYTEVFCYAWNKVEYI